ncbi:hypothetical protein F4775DRAFT_543745 [Biscogniauxia sp. FL1348]|nr:hypothetical protein F4775DRAFT_543745 [Biscogniauxia sp. FL1348]
MGYPCSSFFPLFLSFLPFFFLFPFFVYIIGAAVLSGPRLSCLMSSLSVNFFSLFAHLLCVRRICMCVSLCCPRIHGSWGLGAIKTRMISDE